MKRKILYGVLILIAVLIVFRVVSRKAKVKPAGDSEKRVPVKAIAVKKGNLTESIKLTGDIVGIEVVNVFSQVPGKVHAIMIKEGQRVSKGSTLFKINRDIVGMEFRLAVVESPISGYIGKVLVDKGMTIAPTFPLAQVVNMNKVKAVVNLMEEDINMVKTGMQAEVTVETFPGRVFYGRVYKKSAVLDRLSRTQEVHVLLDNPGLKLKHGMFANVKIIQARKRNITLVPQDAILTDEDGKKFVYTVKEQRAGRRNLKTGVTVDFITEVLSGVSAGDVVITLGKENVSDNDELMVYREDLKKSDTSAEKKEGKGAK